jgi:cytochrome c5
MRPALPVLLLWGCGADPADTGAAGACDDAPVVTWESWGEGFLIQTCQTCHSATTPDRNGAPESVNFDTEDEVLALRDRILARATGDDPTMPPSGGVTEDDRLRLLTWLTCWE